MTLFAGIAGADGSIVPPAGPDDPESAMYTLENIYMRLTKGTEPQKRDTAFTEPETAPAPTGHSINEVMEAAIIPPKTGQKVPYSGVYDGYDDGSLQIGIAWPNPRFTNNEDGTVTDHLTGLMWAQNANLADATMQWHEAIEFCEAMNSANGGEGTYGYNDWRLPNVNEMATLIAYGTPFHGPSVFDTTGTNQWSEAAGPFTQVQTGNYWTSTTRSGSNQGYQISTSQGVISGRNKWDNLWVWPVRGGGEHVDWE